MKPKLLSLFSNLVHRKSTFPFNPGERVLVLIITICSLQDKFGNDFKTFWFRFQNDIGTFLLPFLTLLLPRILLGLRTAAREDDGSTTSRCASTTRRTRCPPSDSSPAPTPQRRLRSPGSGAARPLPSASGIFPHQGPRRPVGYTSPHSNQQNRAGNRFPLARRQGFLHAPPPFSTPPPLGPARNRRALSRPLGFRPRGLGGAL